MEKGMITITLRTGKFVVKTQGEKRFQTRERVHPRLFQVLQVILPLSKQRYADLGH